MRALWLGILSLSTMAMTAALTANVAIANPAACGPFFPVEVGKTWYYEPAQSVITVTPTAGSIMPRQPKDISIRVAAIETTATGGATVSLEETFDKVAIKTTVTCEKGNLTIDPASFLFSGEPGGVFGIVLADIVRTGFTWQTNGITPRATFREEWHDDFKANYSRPTHVTGANLGAGTLEIVRRWVNEGDEKVIIVDKTYDTTRLALDTTGKINAKGSDKPYDLRQSINTMWFSRGTGVIKVQNSYGHAYQLRLTPPAPPTMPAAPPTAPAAP